jgi:hypothetical protein
MDMVKLRENFAKDTKIYFNMRGSLKVCSLLNAETKTGVRHSPGI